MARTRKTIPSNPFEVLTRNRGKLDLRMHLLDFTDFVGKLHVGVFPVSREQLATLSKEYPTLHVRCVFGTARREPELHAQMGVIPPLQAWQQAVHKPRLVPSWVVCILRSRGDSQLSGYRQNGSH